MQLVKVKCNFQNKMSEHDIALFEEYSEKVGLLWDLPHPRKIFFYFYVCGVYDIISYFCHVLDVSSIH